MPNYLVRWVIDADDAATPLAAAQSAWKAMRADGSIANFFTVVDKQSGETVDVDLLDQEEGLEDCEHCGRPADEHPEGGIGGECTMDERECTCASRSWYGAEHDSACDFAGEVRHASI